MDSVTAGHLKAGIIFGDHAAQEYIYLPPGEVGVEEPVCILESREKKQDISLEEAVLLVARLGLKPVRHPRWGSRSY
ncbi:Hypothetical protein LUCI_1897 [Lucifera butyrica]|uniref:Uncharacterized protein n=1 Tax=Lucifera butyrica TaxID=1351585 RepID=A0A498R5J0_9FIRM|nr:hypothetical protein [Lucifera butyrica]VBB06661.1 Hypothetical protein LUCI_1897 [Lucifera butyrica]